MRPGQGRQHPPAASHVGAAQARDAPTPPAALRLQRGFNSRRLTQSAPIIETGNPSTARESFVPRNESSTIPLAGDCLSARSVPTEPRLPCGSFWRHWRSSGPLAMSATCGRPHASRDRFGPENAVSALSFSGSCGRPRIRPQLEKSKRLAGAAGRSRVRLSIPIRSRIWLLPNPRLTLLWRRRVRMEAKP